MSILSANQARQKRGITAMLVMFFVFTVIFYLKSNRVEDIIFGFVVDKEWQLLNEWKLSSKRGAALFLLVALFGIGISYLQFKRAKNILFGSFIFGFGSILAFLCWTASGKFVPFTGILQGAIMFSVPLIFGSMSGLLCEKSGVINIAIEGQLLFAACISAIVASISHSVVIGLVFAPIAGALVSLLLAFFAIKYKVDQVILGFVLNVLVIGITGFIYSKLLVPYGDTWNVGPTFKRIAIPFFSQIPVFGPMFFNQTIVVYLMYAVVVIIQFALFKTRWGLRTRAIGELPIAADSVGIDVNRLRYKNVLFAGLVAGIGGSYFTLGAVGSFTKDMTSGAGFIALACLIFGKWTPKGAVTAALFFGFTTSLQGNLSIIGVSIPSAAGARTLPTTPETAIIVAT
jgi:simple sugar transport system permease protein